MSDHVRIDPAEVLETAPAFSAAEQSLEAALARADCALAGLGDFWGHDEQGGQFAASYSPAASQVLAAVANIARGLGSITPGLQAMADNHSRVDSHYAERMATTGGSGK